MKYTYSVEYSCDCGVEWQECMVNRITNSFCPECEKETYPKEATLLKKEE